MEKGQRKERALFIEHWVTDPQFTLQEIADAAQCSIDWVIKVAQRDGLLEQRKANRKAQAAKLAAGYPKIQLDK